MVANFNTKPSSKGGSMVGTIVVLGALAVIGYIAYKKFSSDKEKKAE